MAKRLVLGYTESGPFGAYASVGRRWSRLGLWHHTEYWLERLERERPDGRDPSNFHHLELLRSQGRFKEMPAALFIRQQ